jgi:hypothetical protein
MKHQSLTQLSTETTYDEIFLSSLRLTDFQNVHLEWLPTAGVERSQAARLQVPAAEHRVTLVPQGDNVTWQNAAFMAFDVLYPAEHNGTLLLHFYVKGESQARFNVRLGLFPQLLTRITLPLRVLDGQTIYLPRTPGRLKGVCQGHRIAPSELSHVTLSLADVGTEQTLFLSGPALLTAEPFYPMPAQPIVDELGQWTAKEWPGKTPHVAALKQQLQAAVAQLQQSSYPAQWSRFGGTTEKRMAPSGFFRIEYSEGRWWLVDPEGCAFWSAGLDCVRPGEGAAIVPRTEKLFSDLPPQNGEFAAAWTSGERCGIKSLDFAVANLIRAFGSNWRAQWEKLAIGRLKEWRFNTVANWSDTDLALRAGMPYVTQLPKFPTTATKLFRDFPDVFDPAYEESARECAQFLLTYKDDEYLIGYFLVNEPHWAFGEFNIASEMLEQNPETHTRRHLAQWLRQKYNHDVATWSATWQHSFTDFEQIESEIFHRVSEVSPGARDDLWEYSKQMVRRYIETACRAMREVDSNHLDLGVRYAWVSSELCYVGGECFDVFSINNYNMEPPLDSIAKIAQHTGRPTIVGEYHFGATDRGLPSSGLRRVASQQERAVAYRYYLEACAADPNTLGAHYFILNDQALLGRFDGENYQIGLVDCCHTPYAEFVIGVQQAHERIYELRQGKTEPFNQRAEELPRLF